MSKRLRAGSNSDGVPSLSGSPKILPVVMCPLNPETSFEKSSFKDMARFMSELELSVGCIKESRIGSAGDLFITPCNEDQKVHLLNLKTVGTFSIVVKLTNFEANPKGVIFNVPITERDEDLLELLREQGVTELKRMTRGERREPLPIVILTFSNELPLFVSIASRRYQVAAHIANPLICHNCWRFGHGAKRCNYDRRCKKCSHDHDALSECMGNSLCPTCSNVGHVAGTPLCPKYNERKQVLRIAHDQNVSFDEAKRRLVKDLAGPTSKPPISPETQLPRVNQNPWNEFPPLPNKESALVQELRAVKEQMELMRNDIEMLKAAQASPPAEVESLRSEIKELTDGFKESISIFKEMASLLPVLKTLAANANQLTPSLPLPPKGPTGTLSTAKPTATGTIPTDVHSGQSRHDQTKKIVK